MDLTVLRKEYSEKGLRKSDLNCNPFKEFEKWFRFASDSKVVEPNAMVLSTVDEHGFPQARAVLLKQWSEEGFVFFTNYRSDKAQQLKKNPKACVLFTWLELERQVKVVGVVKKTSGEESEKYFQQRPRGSQLGAWASEYQSQILPSREVLETRYKEVERQFEGIDKIPLPPYWGGHCLVPEQFEFWQGRANRLHDRFSYQKCDIPPHEWLLERLYP